MAKREKQSSVPERLHEMKLKGYEVTLPFTERKIRLKAIDATAILRSGKVPNVLLPLVTQSIYTELDDRKLREYLATNRGDVKEAIETAESMDYIVKESIADSTKIDDLTIAEKRWIFRLAMGPAELLVTFRDNEESDVGDVEASENVQQAAE